MGLQAILLALGVFLCGASALFLGKPRDCYDYHKLGHTKPGVFKIYLEDDTPVKIYCDHSLNATSNVILRRSKGDTTFYRKFVDYENGFGNIQSDMWAGLKTINSLTKQGNRRLTIRTQDWAGNQGVAMYDYFMVNDARDGYRLTVQRYNQGQSNLPDDLTHNSGMTFATFDRPDRNSCAVHMQGGWWYNYCSYILPTGYYYTGGKYTPSGGYYNGIFYKDYLGFDYSLNYISFILTK